jgi:hypothetical protein
MSRPPRPVAIAVLVATWIAFAAGQAVVDGAETGLPPGLTAPTSPVYADGAWYDIVAVRWNQDDAAVVLEIELGAIDPAGVGDIGMRQPIIEVYVDEGQGGATDLLPGSGLRMPPGTGWSQALRLTGDGAWWWQVVADGERLAPPRSLPVEVAGRVARVTWPTDVAADARVYAISGVYDPFSSDGWRRFTETPSPWAFAAEVPGPPVVDVLPGDAAAWEQMRSSGELPPPAARPGARGPGGTWPWWALMLLGMGMAIAGLVWRARGPTPVPVGVSPTDGADPPEGPVPADVMEVPAVSGASAPGPAPEAEHGAQLIGDDEVGLDARPAAAPDQFSGEVDGATAGSRGVASAPEADRLPSAAWPALPPPKGASNRELGPEAANSTRATDAPTASSRSAKRS